MKSLKTALELYYVDNNGYPTSSGSGNGDVPLSDATLVSKLVPRYIPVMPGLLVSDGDHYYAGGFTTGIAPAYDMLIYNEGTSNPHPCRSGTMPLPLATGALPQSAIFNSLIPRCKQRGYQRYVLDKLEQYSSSE